MAKKEIRTKYIKSLMEDKANLISTLEESTKESLSAMLDEKVNRSLRNMLNESEDDSYEEEVEPEETEFNNEPEETDTDNEQIVDLEGEGENNGTECENGVECDSNCEDSNVWDDVEDCKDADGEYDLRSKDINTVLKVLQSMEPTDGVRIIKNDDNTATVEPDGDEQEFVIDINGGEEEPNEFEDDTQINDSEGDDDDYIDIDSMGISDDDLDLDGSFDDTEDDVEGDDDGEDDETIFELEIDGDDDNEDNNEEDMVNEGQVNLGYTTNYQSKTAMTLPSDKGEGEGDSRFDNGAPKGGANNKKRWVGSNGANGGNPYSQKTKQPVSEMEECGDECIFEVEMDDDMMQMDEHIGAVTNSRNPGRAMHNREQGDAYHPERNTRTASDGYEAQKNLQEMKKKIAMFESENAQLRKIMGQFKEKLDEAVVINASLAKVTKLFTENSTSRDEKVSILNRFDKVHTLNECKNLYNQISNELKGTRVVNNNLLNKQLTEAKSQNRNMIVETNMLGASDEIKRILDLQNRLENK